MIDRPKMIPGPGTQPKRSEEEQKLPAYEQAARDRARALETQRDFQRQAAEYAPPPPVGNIAKAIAGVMREVGTIRKGGRNNFHGYNYARMEDLLYAITPLMGKHGLAVLQNEITRATVEDNQAAVTYEFIVIHESGEQLPPQRFTGMSRFRDSKGGVDDKAINKTHTAARKYFLLSLFQVPAGDFDDGDQEDDKQPADTQKPVPGAGVPPAQPSKRDMAEKWVAGFVQSIEAQKDPQGLQTLEQASEKALDRIFNDYCDLFVRIQKAIEKRLKELNPVQLVMPPPKPDPTAAINWVAQQLSQFKEYPAAEAFWNQYVAPRENEFSPIDFDRLLEEWRRTETRLAPPDDEHDPETGEIRGNGNDPYLSRGKV